MIGPSDPPPAQETGKTKIEGRLKTPHWQPSLNAQDAGRSVIGGVPEKRSRERGAGEGLDESGTCHANSRAEHSTGRSPVCAGVCVCTCNMINDR